MHLGAMVDLGVPAEFVVEQLARLPMANEFDVSFSRGEKKGIAGIRAVVRDLIEPDHSHRHARHYGDIQKLIQQADYAAGIEQRAIGIFASARNSECRR